jgi:hypothetical protein
MIEQSMPLNGHFMREIRLCITAIPATRLPLLQPQTWEVSVTQLLVLRGSLKLVLQLWQPPAILLDSGQPSLIVLQTWVEVKLCNELSISVQKYFACTTKSDHVRRFDQVSWKTYINMFRDRGGVFACAMKGQG